MGTMVFQQYRIACTKQIMNETRSMNSHSINKSFEYIRDGIEAKGHTAVYKMHKYFARRPHNVFSYLIESYTQPGDIVLDCFCGGGVTLFEGLALGRKVVAVDLNPLATFISDCQTTTVSVEEYKKVLSEVRDDVKKLTKRFYTTACRRCNDNAEVRWYELAYYVTCETCGSRTLLANDLKFVSDEKVINGRYACQHCHAPVTAVDAPRAGHELLSVTYRCNCTPGRQTARADDNDKELMSLFNERFDKLIEDYELWYPQDEIPAEWDRQKEDCLHRKSVRTFADLFTRRSLFFNAYLLQCFQRYRGRVPDDLYKMLLFTFSAIIRHTNVMTISTGNWMDGRPVSWAKHAYWIPNQFVEVNPLEYIDKRRDAIVAGLQFQQRKLRNVRRVDSFSQLVSGEGTHVIWTRSSEDLCIPDASVHAVITDPPYGSNVQYGELSHYWLVWLRNELGLDESLFSLDREVLVQRKTQADGHKDYQHYLEGLRMVFAECYRVLKPGGVLVFTFNNKDMKAWYAVTRAAIDAGFHLDERGVVYQEPIENYRNTAHTRYAGSLHGDFIYTFRKETSRIEVPISQAPLTRKIMGLDTAIEEQVVHIAERYLQSESSATTNELYVAVMSGLIPTLIKIANNQDEFAELTNLFDFGNLDTFLNRYFTFSSSTKTWHLGVPLVTPKVRFRR